MRIKPMPPQKEIQRVLHYNAETGVFTHKWRNDIPYFANRRWAERNAGAKGKKSIVIWIDEVSYPAHRLAYVYVHGDVLDTKSQVDHINNNPFNNSISNLRLSTHAQNCSNARKWKKKSLPKGVSRQSNGRPGFRSRLQTNKITVHLGTFNTAEEAHDAYCRAAAKYHGEFARSA